MREKKIEQKLVTAVKKHGGICPKFVSPGFDGMPDRLLLLPHGRFAFVEVKAPNQKPRPLQLSRHRLLRRLGFRVYVLDALEDIDKIIKEVMSNETS
ncbi:VRR-NUC domain-containing protein [Ruminococcus callidus]|uniref:VRR-NUC domain-containing protein n=1 Tax=Ruminococcus callidus TaxID=40519 RepID=UPI0023FA43B2|nr:VRR-NUC domain-containing protein [Ruminococcus callidus]